MKTLSIITMGLLATATLNAQNLNSNEVPSNLQTSFSKTYANANDVEWERDAENYKVEFEVNKMEHEIWYAANGSTVKTEIEMDAASLPSNISNAIKGKYADYKIDNVDLVEEGNKKIYEVEIEKGWLKERKLKIDANGSIISDMED